MSLFKKAAQAAEKPSAKAKTKKKVLSIGGTGFADTLARWREGKAAATEVRKAEGILRPLALRFFIEQLKEQGKRPDSFQLQSDKGDIIGITPVDRWGRIESEAHAIEIEEAFGGKFPGGPIVQHTVSYGFNPEVLEKHLPAIEKAILGADMPQEAKEALIVAHTAYRLRPGLMDDLKHLPVEDVEEVVETLSPQIQLRDK